MKFLIYTFIFCLPLFSFAESQCRAVYEQTSKNFLMIDGKKVVAKKIKEFEANLAFQTTIDPSKVVSLLLSKFSNSPGLRLTEARASDLYPAIQIPNANGTGTLSVGSYIEKALHFNVKDESGNIKTLRYKKTAGTDVTGSDFLENSRTKKELTFKTVEKDIESFQLRSKINFEMTGIAVNEESIVSIANQLFEGTHTEVQYLGKISTHRLSLEIHNTKGDQVGFLAIDRVQTGAPPRYGIEIEIFPEIFSQNRKAANAMTEAIADALGIEIVHSSKAQEHL